MRLSALFVRLGAFALAAAACGYSAHVAVTTVETRSVDAVQLSLEENGYGFAAVLGDGLQVILEGEAPTEADRFRAISTAGTMVDASRVIDNMTVEDTADLVAPEFSMEILRNDSGISIIGLVPATVDREALAATLKGIAGADTNFTDLLESADYAEPEGWDSAMNFALRALRRLPQSKISVRADRVSVEAISDSREDKAEFEAELRRIRPSDLSISMDIMAPRPVVSPFVTRFIHDDGGVRFDSCVADTVEAERQIVAAGVSAGVEGRMGCTVALGAPTTRWADAIVLSIAAVRDLGGGTVTVSDADVTLVAPIGTPQDNFDRVAGELENKLPEVFAVRSSFASYPRRRGSRDASVHGNIKPRRVGSVAGTCVGRVVEHDS